MQCSRADSKTAIIRSSLLYTVLYLLFLFLLLLQATVYNYTLVLKRLVFFFRKIDSIW